eukprot:scaffold3023_cov50-Attheya_sp.AAC.4
MGEDNDDSPVRPASIMSQGQRKRRRPMAPPERLSWPGATGTPILSSSTSSSSSQPTPVVSQSSSKSSHTNTNRMMQDEEDDDSPIIRRKSHPQKATALSKQHKRSNATTKAASATTTSTSTSGSKVQRHEENGDSRLLWVDKHAPTDDPKDLCVAPKKVKQVQSWLDQWAADSSSSNNHNNGGGGGNDDDANMCAKLLVLVGSPGIGKSTMIQVLAAAHHWTIQEWNDAHHDFHGSSYASRGMMQRHHQGDLLTVSYQSQLASFQEFLQSTASGYSKLETTSSSQNNSIHISNSNKLQKKTKHPKGKNANKCNKTSQKNGSIIVIDELPNLHSRETEEQFRSMLSQHIQQTMVPTVLIFSNVCEGRHRPEDLEQLIDPALLYSPLVHVMQCHAVTKPKMKKCLELILKTEGIPQSSPDFYQEIHLTSHGDLRHAIMTLQYQHLGSSIADPYKQITDQHKDANPKRKSQRDTKLSTFHALGKLLYAKRKKVTQERPMRLLSSDVPVEEDPAFTRRLARIDARPPLEYDPERVMNESDIGRGGALSFLQYHCTEFFSDSIELSTALDRFSDAALFLDRSTNPQGSHVDSIYPAEYVSSLGGRAVADANKHPAPNCFRSFGAPKIFDVLRKKRGNDAKMEQLHQRLSGGRFLSSSGSFVTDQLPYLRTIAPHDVNHALDNLYSFVQPKDKRKPDSMESSSLMAAEELRRRQEEQAEILKMDDIVEDDDDDSSNDDDDNDDRFRLEISESAPTSDVRDNNISSSNNNNNNMKRVELESPTSTVDPSPPSSFPEIIVID